MSKVWPITQGSYSDYHIVAAYSTEEKANLGLAEYNRDANHYDVAEIEVWELDTYTPKTDYWIVDVLKDGTVQKAYRHIVKHGETHDDRPNYANFWAEGVEFYIHSTDDKDKAIKIAKDRWAQIVAENLWGNQDALRAMMPR